MFVMQHLERRQDKAEDKLVTQHIERRQDKAEDMFVTQRDVGTRQRPSAASAGGVGGTQPTRSCRSALEKQLTGSERSFWEHR